MPPPASKHITFKMRKQAYKEELQKPNILEKSTQINASFKLLPKEIQKRSCGSQKDLESMATIMCGKRGRICEVKNKKTLLSPLAS